ncbi:MAG: TIGR03905 family TSCPD domain-containing protein [Clostridia bacterium]|nr:TIGR03905 family TSCPD domain-containing protein [Clostridia bacterium]
MYHYKTKGTCSSGIDIELEGDNVKYVHFNGGCTGNTNAVSRLVAGRGIDEVIGLLRGIPCQGNTSCPDQLAQALIQIKQKRAV